MLRCVDTAQLTARSLFENYWQLFQYKVTFYLLCAVHYIVCDLAVPTFCKLEGFIFNLLFTIRMLE